MTEIEQSICRNCRGTGTYFPIEEWWHEYYCSCSIGVYRYHMDYNIPQIPEILPNIILGEN
jgi:hypothetical protein